MSGFSEVAHAYAVWYSPVTAGLLADRDTYAVVSADPVGFVDNLIRLLDASLGSQTADVYISNFLNMVQPAGLSEEKLCQLWTLTTLLPASITLDTIGGKYIDAAREFASQLGVPQVMSQHLSDELLDQLFGNLGKIRSLPGGARKLWWEAVNDPRIRPVMVTDYTLRNSLRTKLPLSFANQFYRFADAR